MDTQSDYQVKARAARADLAALLAPQSATEHQTVAWLMGWDVDTLVTLAGMVRRAAAASPAVADARALREPYEQGLPGQACRDAGEPWRGGH